MNREARRHSRLHGICPRGVFPVATGIWRSPVTSNRPVLRHVQAKGRARRSRQRNIAVWSARSERRYATRRRKRGSFMATCVSEGLNDTPSRARVESSTVGNGFAATPWRPPKVLHAWPRQTAPLKSVGRVISSAQPSAVGQRRTFADDCISPAHRSSVRDAGSWPAATAPEKKPA